jgi:TolA-binding protein
VYLGELASRRGIAYESRRLDTEGQSFLFRIEAAGIYALQFFKQDFIRDFILNDHVQVIAGEIPETAGSFDPALDQERIKAEPRWPDSRAEAELARQGGSPAPASSGGTDAAAAETQLEGAAAAGGKAAGSSGSASVAPAAAPQIQPPASVPGAERNSRPVPGPGDRGPETPVPAVRPPVLTGETAPAVPPDAPPEWFLHRAREVFEAGKTAEAISLLDQFRERYPSGSDEAYWLYGQLYEAAGPERDILSALDYYRRLLWEYPQSSRCNDARRRIAYLERYYINIQ